MIAWFAENAQVDFGNFLVGLGTLMVAAVSFYVARSANAYERNRVYVDYAGLWIEELRKSVSACVGTLEAIAMAATPAERQSLLPKLREQEIYIRLKFDQSDANAKRLFPLLDRIRQDLASGVTSVRPAEEQVIELFREILEKKWDTHTARLAIGKWS